MVLCACAAAVGCEGGETAVVTLSRVTPPADEACGAPADAGSVIVTALGEHPPSADTALAPELAAGGTLAIPRTTRALAVEVLGAGGALRAVGRTAPFSVADLSDGASVPIVTAPPQAFCQVGPPQAARSEPLAAAAADGVLVAGGRAEGGGAAGGAEWYDPASGAFEDLGETLYGGSDLGLVGATMTAMGDGRVVIAGGAEPAYQIFRSQDRRFGPALFLGSGRAHHAAARLSGGQLLLAGGCESLDTDGACASGSALASTAILDIDDGAIAPGPPLSAPRTNAVAIREPGGGVVVLGGETDEGEPAHAAERLDVESGRWETVDIGSAARAAPLVSGSVLAIDEGGAAALVPYGASDAAEVGQVAGSGASATALDTGRVFVIGGGEAGLVAAATGRRANLGEQVGAAQAAGRRGHASIRLRDGSVLIVGGEDERGAPRADAWLFRPELTGPYTSGASIAYETRDLAEQVVPRDPRQAEIRDRVGQTPAHLQLASSGGEGDVASEWVIVAGPRFSAPRVEARVSAEEAVALIVGYRDPEHRLEIALREGEPAALWRVDAGRVRWEDACAADPVPTGALGGIDAPATISVDIGEDGLRARASGEDVLACGGVFEVPAGHVGVGARGGEGAAVRVDSIRAER